MAGPGRAPKEHRSRPADTARRDAAATKVHADGIKRGPDLPADMDWPPQTLAWWDNLRTSPMAQAWITADWDTLLDNALLHRELWTGELKVAAELRLRMSQFGTNPESRLRLRLIVEADAEQAKSSAPVIASDRRQRLLRAVNGTP